MEARAYHEVAQEMCGYIAQHYQTASLRELASRFCYHPNTVETILKRETGKTFLQLLRDIRMDEAARLLRKEHVTVQEAAQRCGYSHMSSFYRRFKERYGMTPGAYAKGA